MNFKNFAHKHYVVAKDKIASVPEVKDYSLLFSYDKYKYIRTAASSKEFLYFNRGELWESRPVKGVRSMPLL